MHTHKTKTFSFSAFTAVTSNKSTEGWVALNSCDITQFNLTQWYSRDNPASSLLLKKSHLYFHSPQTAELDMLTFTCVYCGWNSTWCGFVMVVKNTSRFSEGMYSNTLVLQRSEINDALTWWDCSLMFYQCNFSEVKKHVFWFESYLDWVQLKCKEIWLVQFSATLPETVKCQEEPGRPEDAELRDTLQSSFHHSWFITPKYLVMTMWT